MNETDQGLDKNELIQSFNAAAKTYDSAARLQNYAGSELMQRLEMVRIQPLSIMDLGSGTGEYSRALAGRYKQARVLELDIAENMLKVSRVQRESLARRRFVCADAERLPVAERSLDLVFSNLMLQWAQDPDLLLGNLGRTIRPGGLYIFTTLGPDTLRELRDSWATVDDTIHVNTFIDMHDLGDALIRAGFSDPVMEVEMVKLSYPDLAGLMSDLKRLGAHNVNRNRRRSLTGKSRFNRMQAAYESRRENGLLPASYEIIFGHAWVPGEVEPKARDTGLFSIPLEMVRRTLKKVRD
jgi:malonyl-CoA O-methyltransferase